MIYKGEAAEKIVITIPGRSISLTFPCRQMQSRSRAVSSSTPRPMPTWCRQLRKIQYSTSFSIYIDEILIPQIRLVIKRLVE
jgi:hypothetical protein